MEKNKVLKARIFEKFDTLTDFSLLIGMTPDRLSKIIHGRICPTAEERSLICKKLEVRESEIFSACGA
jgi:hypothetical protein